MERAVTLFPEPLSPTRQTVSPALIVSETPSIARTAFAPRPNSSVRFLISSKAMIKILIARRRQGLEPVGYLGGEISSGLQHAGSSLGRFDVRINPPIKTPLRFVRRANHHITKNC